MRGPYRATVAVDSLIGAPGSIGEGTAGVVAQCQCRRLELSQPYTFFGSA